VGIRVGVGGFGCGVGDGWGVGLTVGVGVGEFGGEVGEGEGDDVWVGVDEGLGLGVVGAAAARAWAAGNPSAAAPMRPKLSRRKKMRRLTGRKSRGAGCRRNCTKRV
jgi:hypothetical protein